MRALVQGYSNRPRRPGIPKRDRFSFALIALVALAGCRHREKRVLRTEPWAAPVAISSASAATLPSAPEGKPVRYVVDQARVTIELPAKKKKPSGSVAKVTGEIDLDVQHPENTRAELRADLLSLSLSANGRDESPELVARAFDWLELSAGKASAEREKDRYAKIEILAFDPLGGPERAGRSAHVVARGTLTLHHFRVPIALELEVQLRGGTADEPSRLSIRTRRPLVVSLVAHDILPRDAAGSLLPDGVRSLGTEVGRDARVTAEISAVASGASPQKQ